MIGRVRELARFEDVDGPWLACIADIDDRPGWLERNNPVSFSYKPAGTSHVFGVEVLRRGLITEVLVLSPASSGPAEPGARLLTLRPSEEPRTTTIHRAPVVGDPRVRQLREDAARRGISYRPSIGQITAVD